MDHCALTYQALITYTDAETRRWHEWFRAHPAALDTPFSDGWIPTIGALMTHIFAVEQRFAERLLDRPVTPLESLHADGLDAIFILGEQARALLKSYFATATSDDLATIVDYPSKTAGIISATKSTLAANVFLHGIRHWGQVATVVRSAGFGDGWPHDYLLHQNITL